MRRLGYRLVFLIEINLPMISMYLQSTGLVGSFRLYLGKGLPFIGRSALVALPYMSPLQTFSVGRCTHTKHSFLSATSLNYCYYFCAAEQCLRGPGDHFQRSAIQAARGWFSAQTWQCGTAGL